MKKSLAFTIFLTILLINLSFISAIKVISEENISKEGTFIAEISGDFSKPILDSKVSFLRERTDKTGFIDTSIDFDLYKMEGITYISAPLTNKAPGLYQVQIEDIEYREAGETLDDDIIINFSISEDLADFSFSPGYIQSKETFQINLENIQDEDIELTLEFETLSGQEGGLVEFPKESSKNTLTLSPGKHTLNFALDLESSTNKILTLSTPNTEYYLPVSLTHEEVVLDYSLYSMKIFPEDLDFKMSTNSGKSKMLYIYNTGSKPITDIEISVSENLVPFVRLSQDEFGQIQTDNNANLNVSVNVGGEKTLEGEIEITAQPGLKRIVPLRIIVEADYDDSEDEAEPLLPSEQTCSQMTLQICLTGEECSGDTIPGRDAACCVGRCVKEEVSSSGKIIGWLLLIIVIGVAAWFFFTKYKKSKNPKQPNLLGVARKGLTRHP